ncbi:MAG: hypothetical protein WDZ39_01005 [Candidatus Spechtbacterales bacterium]
MVTNLNNIKNLTKDSNIYLLDTSAIIENPNIHEYPEVYDDIQENSIFIIIPQVLAEIDGHKYEEIDYVYIEAEKSYLMTDYLPPSGDAFTSTNIEL